MPTVSPERPGGGAAGAKEQEQEDTTLLEGVTSEQVKHAQDESRAEGDPFEYQE
ncbi:hypothetical protein LN042_02375 [Kitasatospora sp. RB6PN24]|uniref:hypothetical protein n=1 Tax=Kitasatospora humi TaxID=2893891 RepID=UPI001E3CCE1A|nr:hypothetical protein [Kitasatospora humi]MCC9305963.1 hypothetical protein [Kitasatospora humi]